MDNYPEISTGVGHYEFSRIRNAKLDRFTLDRMIVILGKVGTGFEDAYQGVGQDLGYPEVKPRLYVYRSTDDLLNDLINSWHYPEWFRTIQAFPRRDWVTFSYPKVN